MEHVPVLLKEAVDGIAVKAGGRYVDGTFGRGGHSREIVRRMSRKVACGIHGGTYLQKKDAALCSTTAAGTCSTRL